MTGRSFQLCGAVLTAVVLCATPVHIKAEETPAAPDSIMLENRRDGRSSALAKFGRLEIRFGQSIPDGDIDELLLGNDSDAGGRATRLETLLGKRIAGVDRACGLSAAQKQKLLIAGHGDVKRFLDRAAELKATFKNGTIQGQDDSVNWVKRVMRLRGASDADQFGTGSLFAKTLKKTLSRDQFFDYCQWRLTHADE